MDVTQLDHAVIVQFKSHGCGISVCIKAGVTHYSDVTMCGRRFLFS